MSITTDNKFAALVKCVNPGIYVTRCMCICGQHTNGYKNLCKMKSR